MKNAPKAAVLYDKFHVMRRLGKALDKIRKQEYGRLSGKERSYIKGQKYTLLSRRENLSLDGKRALRKLLKANKRLNTAYILKESFGQLWEYKRAGWARRFFDNWKASLKWQRLKPYEEFAEMIERHWDGIVMHIEAEDKVSLGFVEGLNNKIRVIQRRAYGLRDEEYLRLKVLTCMLKPIRKTTHIRPLDWEKRLFFYCYRQRGPMDIISDAYAIRGRVVRAENLYAFSFAFCRLEHKWNEMRLRVMAFSNPPFRVCTCRCATLS